MEKTGILEKIEIINKLKEKYKYIIETNEKIRLSEGNFCVKCLSSNNYYPDIYPYKEYLCYRCHSNFQTNSL